MVSKPSRDPAEHRSEEEEGKSETCAEGGGARGSDGRPKLEAGRAGVDENARAFLDGCRLRGDHQGLCLDQTRLVRDDARDGTTVEDGVLRPE